MTKGGTGKSKTLGRLIFGEKRKQHASPSRHRSSTRYGSTTDLASANGATTNKNSVNLHDWAVWRMQLNEQMGTKMNDRSSDLKHLRQFLQSNPFYQQHSRDPSTGRYNGVRLLFSIPHAKLKPEFLNGSQGMITKYHNNEIGDTVVYEQKKIRSNSDDRTTTSVNSISAIQPMIMDRTINYLFPKPLAGNTGGFLHVNEQMVAADGIRTRRTARSSFTASDRIHATLQKAVKDGNVLEKIKAFEMQAAAAQAESIVKLSGINHRMQSIQSVAHRTLSPATIYPIQNSISPLPIHEQSIRSSRGRYINPVSPRRDGTHGHGSRKGAHVLEPAHGDVILKCRTPSQKTGNDEDYSVTAISSMALSASQSNRRNQHRHHHHRTSASHSRHRQDTTYGKRTPSANENHSNKQKGTTIPSTKSITRRRWLKGRKETPTDTPYQGNKEEVSITKSNKTKKKSTDQEKRNAKKVSKSIEKEKFSSDNNRVYGVPNTNVNEQINIDKECELDHMNHSDTNKLLKEEENKESNTIPTTTIQRRSSKKQHQPKLSSTDGEILSKIDEDIQFSPPIDNDTPHFEDNASGGEVSIEDIPIKPPTHLTRHQSIINSSNKDSRRFQQQSTNNTLRRHASQRSADEIISSDQDYQQSEFNHTNTLKKKQSPIILTTRNNKINQDEHIVYETPRSEQIQEPVCDSHTFKKKRPCHTSHATGNNTNNGQNNNKQISKQILHAIMNSMNSNNQEQTGRSDAISSPVDDEFFENGPLTNPEETIANITTST